MTVGDSANITTCCDAATMQNWDPTACTSRANAKDKKQSLTLCKQRIAAYQPACGKAGDGVRILQTDSVWPDFVDKVLKNVRGNFTKGCVVQDEL